MSNFEEKTKLHRKKIKGVLELNPILSHFKLSRV